MTAPTLVLMTTSDMVDGPSPQLRRMIESVERFRERMPAVSLHAYLLLQRSGTGVETELPAWLTLLPYAHRMSLSAARNVMIARALGDGVDDDAVVGFPDDDAWFPAGTLDHILARFAAQPALDLWFCRYGTGATGAGDARAQPATLQQTLSYGSSNTIFVRGRVLSAIGGFDEALGVGTPAGGGEDTEFAIRAFHAARAAEFLDAAAVGHRDGDPTIRAKYYAGSLRAITLHAGRSPAARMAWARKLAVGALFTALGRLKPRAYASAIAAAHRRG